MLFYLRHYQLPIKAELPIGLNTGNSSRGINIAIKGK
jgi:hypothetical protein